MKLIKKCATKNVLDNTKTIMDFADNILLPSKIDLESWFDNLNIELKAIFSIRFYIQEIFDLREKNKDDENNNTLHQIIDETKSYFYEEKYIDNEQWWNIEKFQKSILKLTNYIQNNDTYLEIYLNPSREMLYEISSQTTCDASYLKIDNLKPFSRLLLLQDLSLQESSLCSLDGIEHLAYINILNIKNNSISSLAPLSFLKGLKWLGASKNNIKDISALSSMTNLEQLDLRWNKIKDISALRELKELKILYCGINNIESLQPLSQLKELIVLGCSKNYIRSIKPLSNLDKLIKILICDNEIEHIQTIAPLKQVVSFDFRNNKVKSIQALSDWENIKNIGFDGNPIPKKEIKEFIKSHESCFIHNNKITQQGL